VKGFTGNSEDDRPVGLLGGSASLAGTVWVLVRWSGYAAGCDRSHDQRALHLKRVRNAATSQTEADGCLTRELSAVRAAVV